MVEQSAHNALVAGSSPARTTSYKLKEDKEVETMRQIFWYTPIFIYLLSTGQVSRLSFRRLGVATGPKWMRMKPYISGWQSLLYHVRYRPQRMMWEGFRYKKVQYINPK